MRYCVETRDGNSYKGELRDGSFEVDGNRFAAERIVRLRFFFEGLHGTGHIELSDGSLLRIKQWTRGWLHKKVHMNLAGELVLLVDDFDKELLISASDILEVYRTEGRGSAEVDSP